MGKAVKIAARAIALAVAEAADRARPADGRAGEKALRLDWASQEYPGN